MLFCALHHDLLPPAWPAHGAAPARASSFDPLDVAASKSTSAARQVLFPEIVGSTPREWIASARLGADEAEDDDDAKGAGMMRSGSTKSSMATAAGVLALAGLAVGDGWCVT